MSEKKAYPLRINADVLAAAQRWADDELRSLNAQIEYAARRPAQGRPPAETHAIFRGQGMSKRWSYQTIEVKTSMMGLLKAEDIQSELSRQGQLGWELVNIIIPAPMRPAMLVFKKEA